MRDSQTGSYTSITLVLKIAKIWYNAFAMSSNVTPIPEAHIQTFRSFLSNFQLLNLNLPIIEKFAEVRAHLRRRGQMISDFDILLGATAMHHNLIVLTYNKKHFERIPDLKIYQS